jgi:uncharacterized membrane protein YsdA (DUF1294 family)
MYLPQLLISVLTTINLIAFFTMASDKRKSVVGNNTERTPEGVMFFLSSIFGSIGIYAGMQVFRHKTKKWYFQVGIPVLILQNAALVYLVWDWLWIN